MLISYLTAARNTWQTEWRHTYRSARREWPRHIALKKWALELHKGATELPVYAREIREHSASKKR